MPAGRPADNSFKQKPTFSLINPDEREDMQNLHGVGSKASG
jgi:hypothetical protein